MNLGFSGTYLHFCHFFPFLPFLPFFWTFLPFPNSAGIRQKVVIFECFCLFLIQLGYGKMLPKILSGWSFIQYCHLWNILAIWQPWILPISNDSWIFRDVFAFLPFLFLRFCIFAIFAKFNWDMAKMLLKVIAGHWEWNPTIFTIFRTFLPFANSTVIWQKCSLWPQLAFGTEILAFLPS